MSFLGDSAFATFVADAFAVFMFILWFWLFITAASDPSGDRTYRASARCFG